MKQLSSVRKIALALKSRVPWRVVILKELNFPNPALASWYLYSSRIIFQFPLTIHLWVFIPLPRQEKQRVTWGLLVTCTVSYFYFELLWNTTTLRKSICWIFLLGWTTVKVWTLLTLSVWVFTVNHLLGWMESESHLPKLLSQQTLQPQARTGSGNTVHELSIGSVCFLDYYFLVAILLCVISSFTLNLLLFCEISELWGMSACFLLSYDWGGRAASRELELPARRISVLKALNSRALFPIAKQKHKSSNLATSTHGGK